MLIVDQIENASTWRITSSQEICYDVVETTSIFNPENRLLLSSDGISSRRFVIIDEKLYKSHLAVIKAYFNSYNISCTIFPIKAQEKNKNFKTLFKIYKELDIFGLKRRSEPVILIGGGVVLDAASFAVDTYRRGIPYIRVPTTLMAYIDVALGVKTGINFNEYKNRIGSFSAPILNILDRSFFKTLPKRHVVNGIAEIIKIAIIKDAELFRLIEQEIVKCIADKFLTTGDEILKRAIQGMLEELEPNLFEKKLERIVDFGHTFSTMLEMHNVSSVLHGEAVAIDMLLSSALSYVEGILKEKNLIRIFKLISRLALPDFSKKITPKLLWESLKDRTLHRDGLQRFPLPVKIGQITFVNNITYRELCQAIKLFKNLLRK